MDTSLLHVLLLAICVFECTTNPIHPDKLCQYDDRVIHSGVEFLYKAKILEWWSQSYGTVQNLNCHSITFENHFNNTIGAPIFASSTCPWYYEITERNDTLPSWVLQAKGKCGKFGCIGVRGTSDRHQCAAITSEIEEFNLTTRQVSNNSITVGYRCVPIPSP